MVRQATAMIPVLETEYLPVMLHIRFRNIHRGNCEGGGAVGRRYGRQPLSEVRRRGVTIGRFSIERRGLAR